MTSVGGGEGDVGGEGEIGAEGGEEGGGGGEGKTLERNGSLFF